MNAKEKLEKNNDLSEMDQSLINVEKAKPVSIWERIKKSFSAPDLTLEDWEYLESKRGRHSYEKNYRRDF